MMRYDVAIIGSGPAGLSAAITLKIRNKNIILFGEKDLSNKVSKAHEIHNYLGLPSISGQDLMLSFRKHIEEEGIDITEDDVVAAYKMGDYYSLTTKSNEMYEASAIIVASGVNFGKPYEGEEEFLGRGVSYCATCDAPLYKDKTIVIIADSAKEEEEAIFMGEVCQKVYYIPNYEIASDSKLATINNIELINAKPQAITGAMKADTLVTDQGEIQADGIFILRDAISPKQLVPGLELDGNHIRVNRQLETNLAGCFACGDITGAPYQYIKSAGEGNVAALSAVKYLA